ncbi:MAG: hypothetical protein HY512_01885 [Candidatus Aenigmarchaeota archaeon]|nr:hypothetical protein [Candidatus Aenigmarchaeota archaeon]
MVYIFGNRTIVGQQLDVDRVSIPGRTLNLGDVALELSREEKGIMLYLNVVGDPVERVFEEGPFADEPAGLDAYGRFKRYIRGETSRIEIVEGKLSVISSGENPKDENGV